MAFNFNKENISKSINNAYYARENLKTLSWQILIAAILTGAGTKSWIWFGITFVGLIIALRIPYLGALLCIILGGSIGIAVGGIAGALGGAACGWTIGILVGIFLILVNLNGRSA